MGHGDLRETVVSDVEPLKKRQKRKEAGARYFRRIGMPNFVLGRKQKSLAPEVSSRGCLELNRFLTFVL